MNLPKVISIESGRNGRDPQSPTPINARPQKRTSVNQWTRRRALRQFFLLGSGVWKVQRETGLPTKEIENDLREFGWAEFERQQKKAA